VSIQNNQELFIPQNHAGVFYLFSRNHEKLGFRNIVRINSGTPDLVAITDDGEKVGIELEFKSSDVFDHYEVLSKEDKDKIRRTVRWNPQTMKYSRGKWEKEENVWKFKHEGKALISKEDSPNYWFHENMETLLYKTVKVIEIDVIMYWEKNLKDGAFKFWEFDKDVKGINLSEFRAILR